MSFPKQIVLILVGVALVNAQGSFYAGSGGQGGPGGSQGGPNGNQGGPNGNQGGPGGSQGGPQQQMAGLYGGSGSLANSLQRQGRGQQDSQQGPNGGLSGMMSGPNVQNQGQGMAGGSMQGPQGQGGPQASLGPQQDAGQFVLLQEQGGPSLDDSLISGANGLTSNQIGSKQGLYGLYGRSLGHQNSPYGGNYGSALDSLYGNGGMDSLYNGGGSAMEDYYGGVGARGARGRSNGNMNGAYGSGDFNSGRSGRGREGPWAMGGAGVW